jgi:threonine/homoserine/homoserine lactone efflux protein
MLTLQALVAFSGSLLFLFALPGPSNAYVLSAGTRFGMKANYATVPMATFGYVLVVGLLLAGIAPWLEARPYVAKILRVACAAYLLFAAFKIWRSVNDDKSANNAATSLNQITRDTLVITLLNPKSLVVALTLAPMFFKLERQNLPELSLILLVTAIMGGLACFAYTTIGGILVLSDSSQTKKRFILRASALVIVMFAALLVLK